MERKIESDIKQIIARTFPGAGNDRETIEKVFSALAKHQESFLNELSERITEEKNGSDWNSDFDIVARLVKRDDTESKLGLFPIDVGSSLIFSTSLSSFEKPSRADDEFFKTSFFIDTSYKDIDNFCAPKKYQGLLVTMDGTTKNFTYSLQRHDRFVRNEKILFDVAALYKINRPVIFSPYARKAVDLKIDGLDKADFKNFKNFDLMLEENNLNGRLLVDYQLCWNVKIEHDAMRRISEVEEQKQYVGADGKLIRYECFHSFDKGTAVFVLPDQHCDDLRITATEDEKKIILGYHSVLKEHDYKTLTLSKVEKGSTDTFTNDFPRKNNKLRLRTEGDLERVLACFNVTRMGKNFPAGFKSLGSSKNLKPIEIYSREDSYYVPNENRLLGAGFGKPTCYINFSTDSTLDPRLLRFKADYVNYVIHYLSQNYPEFNWAGVEA